MAEMRRIEQAGGIVLNQTGQLLMVKALSNRWTFPKGKIEPGEDARQAARREIKEETGVSETALIERLGSYERPGFTKDNLKTPSVIKHITLYLFRTGQQDLQVDDEGTLTAEWVGLDEAAQRLSHEKDRKFFLAQQEVIRTHL